MSPRYGNPYPSVRKPLPFATEGLTLRYGNTFLSVREFGYYFVMVEHCALSNIDPFHRQYPCCKSNPINALEKASSVYGCCHPRRHQGPTREQLLVGITAIYILINTPRYPGGLDYALGFWSLSIAAPRPGFRFRSPSCPYPVL